MAYRAARTLHFLSLALLAAFPYRALAAPPASPQASQAATTLPPKPPAYPIHHRRRIHHRVAAPYNLPGAVRPPATPPSDRGYVPAPVVAESPPVTDANANLIPPQNGIPTGTQLQPGTMQLHYPFAGNGYVTGSSPQAMDDATTAKIPGVIVNVPLQPKAPQPLPPP